MSHDPSSRPSSAPSHPTRPAVPATSGLRRRTLFGATAASAGLSLAVTGAGAPAAVAAPAGGSPGAAVNGLPRALARRFARPTTATAAGFRWWWPHGAVSPAEVRREVDQVADAGFGVLEIADVTHSLRARDIEFDLERQGWGTPAWIAGVKAALSQGARRGVRIDLTVGPSWPAAVSTITPDDEAACAELAHGAAVVAAGAAYDGVVPPPVVEAAEAATRSELVAVQAYRDLGTVKAVTTLDPASRVDLTDRVADGRLAWTAPDDGPWVVLSYWRRGSAQEPEAGPHTSPRSYVVDHFSARGSGALIDLWQDRILDPQLRRLLGAAGGYLFEDSLEIETDATIWTPRMLEEFQKRAGYDLLPYLPVVVEAHEKYLYAFDPVVTTRVRDDFNQVLSDLYRDHHLLPVQAFARSLGMGLRVQPYGLETDTVEHSSLLDVPETESLGFKNLDDYRVMAGGRDMRGTTVLSCEAACYFGAAYQTTWDRALQTLNSIYAGGVNMAVLHGFAYADAPGVTWPGFAAFSPYYDGAVGYGEAWGPRTPQWRHVRDVADYLARTQLVLQTGRPVYDVVFLRQKGWTSTGIGAPWATNVGIPTGWTHSFLTPALLDLPRAKVSGGRLGPGGPSYKAMVIGPDQFRGGERTMAVATASKVLALARQGLPVVLLGDWSTAEPVGRAEPGETEELRGLLGELSVLSTTRQVLVDTEIPTALADLGVEPDVRHEASTVMTVRRRLGLTDLYYVANAKHAENRRLVRVTQDLWLTAKDRSAVPVRLDAWSGRATPVAVHERDGDRVRVGVDLLPGQSTIIALVPPARGRRSPSVRSTSAAAVLSDGHRLTVRAASAGDVETVRAGGGVVTTTVGRVREPLALEAWVLEAEDWRPGAAATQTVKPVVRVQLDALVPWSALPGLEDASGIGRYRTQVDLGGDWKRRADGAWLELGEVNDTFRVTVNGTRLDPADPLATTVDLGHLLTSGVNTIEVEVATTLINRLRTVTPEVYAVAPRQAYGLVGPVRLVPYVDTPLG
ncbi:glycosyl hydrolase [Nocardioides sp. P86]|uniref:glycosyl hydrolase n=1 Tax=Nocardioides sp. P86 TaxID=2939569 RepID=UPI00203A9082|nr:glycosyl hydrolase [Nocardioides sp. P86]